MKTIFELLKYDLDERDAKGWQEYRRPLLANDGRDTLRDIFEELLDALVYVKKLMIEREGWAGKSTPACRQKGIFDGL